MKRKTSKILAITAIFTPVLLILCTTNITALSCSFTYSSKGGCIYLTPTLSSDTTHYRWIIERINNTQNTGSTTWIHRNESFIQVFALEYASEYHVILEVKDISGATITFSRFIHTSSSSLSVQEGIMITEKEEEITKMNAFDQLILFFSPLPLLGKVFFVLILVVISFFMIDVVFNVSKKKGVLYSMLYNRR